MKVSELQVCLILFAILLSSSAFGGTQSVRFVDPALTAAVRNALGKPQGRSQLKTWEDSLN